MTERYIACRDFPSYLVSNYGNVKNFKGKILSLKSLVSGYPVVSLSNGEFRKKEYVHRLVAKEFCAGYAEGMQVNHLDGDKKNANASNLQWVTHTENARHAVATSLRTYPPHKLTDQDVIDMFNLAKLTSKKEATNKFKVDARTINDILKGRNYKHLTQLMGDLYGR